MELRFALIGTKNIPTISHGLVMWWVASLRVVLTTIHPLFVNPVVYILDKFNKQINHGNIASFALEWCKNLKLNGIVLG